ncbi:MAG: L-seryl-tRNA(Sec) selenium transferase [Casimicrobiaceae bacterium]
MDRLLKDAALQEVTAIHGRVRVREALRAHLAALRSTWRAGGTTPAEPAVIARAVSSALGRNVAHSMRPVANLTGTVLHTNLGRALLPEEAIAAMAQAAREHCNLEFDLDTGARGERDAHVESLVAELTGAEGAIVVNNNAAGVLLTLNTLAARRGVIVSRGELVEIGGNFRLPDIMGRAGARLHEVGTTNRTALADYADAIGPRTALIMKVHTSNYEICGFTAAVAEAELAALAHGRGLPMATDLGSGTLVDLRSWGLPQEPTARESIAAGVDLVSFSGDKLLGGPQCGIVAGRATLIAKLRKNPLKRALRVDKLTLAALEQVLLLYRDPDRLAARLPTLRVLARSPAQIRPIADDVADALRAVLPVGYAVSVVECASQIGSGALPVARLPSAGVRVEPTCARRERNLAATKLQSALRQLPLPIIGRMNDGSVLLDCRCIEDAAPIKLSIAALNLRDNR